jgi:hypothetical protein
MRPVGPASGTVVSPEKRRGGVHWLLPWRSAQAWALAAVAAASFFVSETG